MTEALLNTLRSNGLIDENGMHDWEEMQYPSDSSTERVKRHRERAKEHLCNVPSNVSETAQIRLDSEEIQRREETETETLRDYNPLISPRVCPPGLKHAWCDGRMHVPVSLHREFQRLSPNGFDLESWYAATDEAWAEKAIGDDAFGFWRARWREKHGTTRPTESELRNPAPKTPEQRLDEIEEISKSKEAWPAKRATQLKARGKE